MILSQPFRGSLRITQHFGDNPEVYGQFDLSGHNGIDFGMPSETEVVAATDATVIVVSDQGASGYGKYIRLRTSDNYELTYGHLHRATVTVGQQVQRGDIIAYSDNTGFSTGPHLHFGVRQFVPGTSTIANYDNGYKGGIDPQPFFQTETSPLPSPLQPDPELLQAQNFVVTNNIMSISHGSQPLLRQDAERILYRFAVHFHFIVVPGIAAGSGHDLELILANNFVTQYTLMMPQAGDQPLLRQDAARIFFRFAQRFGLIPAQVISVNNLDAELNAAANFLNTTNIMSSTNGNQPLFRQDAMRVLYRFAQHFNLQSR